MTDEIQIISDGDGMAVLGQPALVAAFLDSVDVPSSELDLGFVSSAIGFVGSAGEAVGTLMENSGRWVQLTKESAEALAAYGPVHKAATDLMIGVVRGADGKWTKMLEFSPPSASLLNPNAIAAIGTLMAQRAMQQKLEKLEDYLEAIDEKVDDILRNQKDAALADMVGVRFVLDEAMAIRAQVGRVSDVTWSKVQATSSTVGRTQAYALRQLDALADELEGITDVDEVAKRVKSTEVQVKEWIAVLVECFRLQEATALLELDRVLDSSPQDLDQHRLGLRAAREHRFELIASTTTHLMERMNTAASRANKWVLVNPVKSPAIVRSTNRMAEKIGEFQELVGVGAGDLSVDARGWRAAAGDLRTSAVETGAAGLGAGVRLGGAAIGRARSLTNKLATNVANRTATRPEEAESGR